MVRHGEVVCSLELTAATLCKLINYNYNIHIEILKKCTSCGKEVYVGTRNCTCGLAFPKKSNLKQLVKTVKNCHKQWKILQTKVFWHICKSNNGYYSIRFILYTSHLT